MSKLTSAEGCRAVVLLKTGVLAVLATAFCAGGSCTVNIEDPHNPGGVVGYVPLDEAVLELEISQGSGDAEATAEITDSLGHVVRLRQGQQVAINGRPLIGPDTEGQYQATFAAVGEYTIMVNEPTRGVSNTTVEPPPACSIVEPASGGTASLSGFVIRWTTFDPEMEVEVTLTQVLFGAEQTATFGPFTDTGSQGLSASDLAEFRQGAPLLISVTRILETYAVGGFGTAAVRVENSDTISVTPTP